MNREIERKYIIGEIPNLDKYKHKTIIQGYLYIDNYSEVRIRKVIDDDIKYYYTVKINVNNLVRKEEEEEIDSKTYNELENKILKDTNIIVKDRYIIPKDNLKIELDIYQGILEGLKIMEVEFNNEIEAINFKLDGFDIKEVTNDINYKNKTLAKKRVK